MLLRFRSVVPYTLPGVLALIGWWWYASRKKERLISDESSEGPPSADTSHLEGRNGVDENGTATPPREVDFYGPPSLNHQRTPHEILSPIHTQDVEAAHSLVQSSDDPDPLSGRLIAEDIFTPTGPTSPSHEEDVTGSSLKPPGRDFLIVSDGEFHSEVAPGASSEDAITSHHATKVTRSSSVTRLSGAERPEPEGEVAMHQSSVNTQDEIVCALTLAKTPRVLPSEADSLETCLSADVHKLILTSTPTSLTFTVQDPTSMLVTSEDIRIKSSTQEEPNLELLAAGLITEVISAATQEVLGVTKVSPGGSSPAVRGQLCSLEEPVAGTQQHGCHPRSLVQGGPECREAADVQGVPNGGSMTPARAAAEASNGVCKTNVSWPPPPHQASPGLNVKRRGDEGTVLTEDSACSTCHSEDGVSLEELQSGVLENQTDVLQVTDLSLEAVQPLSLVEAGPAAPEESSVDAAGVLKRLNGIGSRNGAHGTCEVDTDQSGGSDVNSMDSVDSGCTMGACEGQGNNAASSNSELVIWEIEVPKHLVGRLIGKQGRYVSFLKQNSGAKIYISTLPYTQEFQICHIEGVQQQVDKALALIGKKFKDLDLTNLYAPPPPSLSLPSLPMTSWLLLPSGVTVEVVVVNIVSAGHVFVQQHTHPTYHALRSLDQQMFLCYSQPGTPALPSPAEVGVICAAPAVDGAWWRAQVITFYKDSDEVEIRYVDYGGYDRVKTDSLRQIRSDFVTLPFQGAEVLLDNIVPLPGEDRFSAEATSTLEEMTRGVALLAQVSNYDNNTGLPLVHLWNMVGDEVVSVNRTLAERNQAVWVDGF
nr:A kinase (PRKA) anchor protein 1b [Nothobranchius furzeri]XP_054594600.1 A kinase (PRKA) anchor protein 1b [Nothobranchius furzeri]